jgi:hypothetical protein
MRVLKDSIKKISGREIGECGPFAHRYGKDSVVEQ